MERYVIHLRQDHKVEVDADREEWTDNGELLLYKEGELIACFREIKGWVRPAEAGGIAGLYL